MSEEEETPITAALIKNPNLQYAAKPITLTTLIQDNDLDELKARLNSSPCVVRPHEIKGAFLWACNAGHYEAVSIFIDSGVDVNLTDQFGASALHHAVQGSHPDIVTLLIDNEALFLDWEVEEESILHWAARNGFVGVINTLIDHNASLTTPDGYGRYPIHSACLYGVPFSVPALLPQHTQSLSPTSTLLRSQVSDEVGNSRFTFHHSTPNCYGPNVIDANGWTPLHYACTSSAGNPQEVVNQLLKIDANPLIMAPNGKTAIDLAFESGRDYLFLSYLPVSDILLILTKTDSIRPEKSSQINETLNVNDGKDKDQYENEQQLGKGNMKKLKRNYSFLHDVFHRISKTNDKKVNKHVRLGLVDSDPHAKLKELSLTTVWKNILQNDDADLLELLRDFRVHESGTDNRDLSYNNFEDAYQLEPRILSEIHLSCFENGLAIFSFMKGKFHKQLEDKEYEGIFLELTKFNARSVGPEIIDGCTVMWPIHSSILFIALLCGRLRVVQLLLRMRQFDVLPTIFVVILIMRRLTKEASFSDDVKCSLCEFCDKLETLAVDIINKVFLRDNSKEKSLTIGFINKRLACLGQATIIDIAARASCATFLSLPCSQVVLYNLWHGNLHWLPYSWKLLSRICPPLLPLYFVNKKYDKDKLCVSSRKMCTFDYSRSQHSAAHVKGRNCGNHRHRNVSSMEDLSKLSVINKMKLIKYVFTVPSNKFIYHSLFHIIYLFIFSYVLLYDFRFHISILEAFCHAFLLGYTIEEARQIILQGINKKLWAYITDTWNFFDITAIIITLCGFILRLPFSSTSVSVTEEVTNTTMFAARILLLAGLLIFYMRILIVFSLFSRLGPKLRMMFAMMWFDLLPMLCIFVLFFIAFGITFQATMYPNGYDLTKVDANDKFVRQSSRTMLANVVRRSFYGMMAAEYNLEILDFGTSKICDASKNCRSIVSVSRNLIIYGFQILYVLIVNIMLVNLLIALYSNTVAHINEKSTAHWLADKYSLIHEFRQRSVCPPPLNVISIFVEMILSCCRRRRKKCKSSNSQCNCKTIRYLVTQGFTLRSQRYKIGKTSVQEANELLDRLTSMEKEVSEIKSILKRNMKGVKRMIVE